MFYLMLYKKLLYKGETIRTGPKVCKPYISTTNPEQDAEGDQQFKNQGQSQCEVNVRQIRLAVSQSASSPDQIARSMEISALGHLPNQVETWKRGNSR